MVGALRDAGADVLLFTLPDPVPINPLARAAAARLVRLNADDPRDRGGARRHRRRPRRAPRLLGPAALERGPPARQRRGPPPDRAGGGSRARPPGRRRVVDGRLHRPARPPLAAQPRDLVRPLLHALADPPPPRPLLRRRPRRQAPHARPVRLALVDDADGFALAAGDLAGGAQDDGDADADALADRLVDAGGERFGVGLAVGRLAVDGDLVELRGALDDELVVRRDRPPGRAGRARSGSGRGWRRGRSACRRGGRGPRSCARTCARRRSARGSGSRCRRCGSAAAAAPPWSAS